MTTCERVADMQSSRISPSLVCTRRRRSQSIPAELSGPATGPVSERPVGGTQDREARAADAVIVIISVGEVNSGGCMQVQITNRFCPVRNFHWLYQQMKLRSEVTTVEG